MNWLAINLYILAVLGTIAWGGACIDAYYSRRNQKRDGINGINAYMMIVDLRSYTLGFIIVLCTFAATTAQVWIDNPFVRGWIVGLSLIAIFVLIPLMGVQIWFERRRLRARVRDLSTANDAHVEHSQRASDGE